MSLSQNRLVASVHIFPEMVSPTVGTVGVVGVVALRVNDDTLVLSTATEAVDVILQDFACAGGEALGHWCDICSFGLHMMFSLRLFDDYFLSVGHIYALL